MSSIIKGLDAGHIEEGQPGSSVIYRFDQADPLNNSEILVLGGAGRYTFKGLREKARKEIAEIAKDLQVDHPYAFQKSAYNIKQLANTLNTIKLAYTEMEEIKRQGGTRSRNLKGLEETHSTGTTIGSAGIGGGSGLGIEKSPIEKVLEKPLGETIQSSQGGMGQAYRKFTPKSAGVDESEMWHHKPASDSKLTAKTFTHQGYTIKCMPDSCEIYKGADKVYATQGDFSNPTKSQLSRLRGIVSDIMLKKRQKDIANVKEEQAPMFTPEDEAKMVNANDPGSDGWRVYKAVPAGMKESSIMKGLQNEGNVITWSKDNPPPPQLLLNTLIQILMKPENHKSPQDLINLWNEKYGLKLTLNSLRQYAQNDYKKMELSKALQKAALANESFERK